MKVLHTAADFLVRPTDGIGRSVPYADLSAVLNAFARQYLAYEAQSDVVTSGQLDLGVFHALISAQRRFWPNCLSSITHDVARQTRWRSKDSSVSDFLASGAGYSVQLEFSDAAVELPYEKSYGCSSADDLDVAQRLSGLSDPSMAVLTSPLWLLPFDLVPVVYRFASLPEPVAVVYGAIKLVRDIISGRAYRRGSRRRRHRGAVSTRLRCILKRRRALSDITRNHAHERHGHSLGDDEASSLYANVFEFTKSVCGKAAQGMRHGNNSCNTDRSDRQPAAAGIRRHQLSFSRAAGFAASLTKAA